MEGRNYMHLNEKTMLVMVQHYFDTVLFSKDHAQNAFHINVAEKNNVLTFIVDTLPKKEKGQDDARQTIS